MAEHPGATIGQTRDYAIEMLGQVCGAYGDSSAAIAAEFFEAIVSAEGYDDLVATVYEGPDLDAIERGVRYQTGKLVNGDTDGFVDGVSELAWYHTKRAANQTSYQSATSRLVNSDYFETTSKAKRREAYNAGRRNKSRIRYARVPTGIETCTYCVMLASRGFVYRDEEVAGHGDHRGCDCLIVPGVAGSTTIGGYDREQMLELYSRYDQIDHEAPLDDDGNLLTGKAAEEWRDARKREAMRDVIGREQWSVESGEVRKTESGHVWQRGRRVQGLEGLDRVELGRRYAEIDRTAYYDSAGRPLRGSALEQRRRSEKIAAEQRMLRESASSSSSNKTHEATSANRGSEREREFGVRYDKAMVVDADYVASDEYAAKYRGLTADPDVDDMLLDGARHALERNSGAETESMTFIDMNTKESLTIDCDIPGGINYTDEVHAFIDARHNMDPCIAVVHNHPNGTPPSADDLSKMAEHNYAIGVVAGHNGQVYAYSYHGPVLDEALLDSIAERAAGYCDMGYDVDRAFSEVFAGFDMSYELRKGGGHGLL